ncbi:MAG: ABC transporter permease [Oscillospiraceae bacterium]|nr:ABC transporter permease [Oscillospiraceae bacterium]MCL2278199.1 ABC transporter permease [Oscillospiraceae bacterium]
MKKRIILISVNVLLVIGFFVCIGISNRIISPLHAQQAAAAWGGQSGERFAQISAFFPENHSFTLQNIRELRNTVENSLMAVSVDTSGEREFYTDAWVAEGSVLVVGERGRGSASVIGVGGNFFMFHPLRLRDGGYISPNDLMRDRILLDEELAWRLFGSVQIAGLQVLINNQAFTIAGVVARESDFASRRAYDGGEGLFMSFEALYAMTDGGARIISYKIVMPDPVTSFAYSTISEFFGDSEVLLVENNTRFSLPRAFSAIASFGERGMQTVAIQLPYWENAARLAEDMQALLLAISLVLIITPVVFTIILLVKLIRQLFKGGKRKLLKAIEEHDRREYEKYLAKHHGNTDHGGFSVDEIIREVNGDNF